MCVSMLFTHVCVCTTYLVISINIISNSATEYAVYFGL